MLSLALPCIKLTTAINSSCVCMYIKSFHSLVSHFVKHRSVSPYPSSIQVLHNVHGSFIPFSFLITTTLSFSWRVIMSLLCWFPAIRLLQRPATRSFTHQAIHSVSCLFNRLSIITIDRYGQLVTLADINTHLSIGKQNRPSFRSMGT